MYTLEYRDIESAYWPDTDSTAVWTRWATESNREAIINLLRSAQVSDRLNDISNRVWRITPNPWESTPDV